MSPAEREFSPARQRGAEVAPDIRWDEGVAEQLPYENGSFADIRAWFPLAGVEVDEREMEAIIADAEQALSSHVNTDGTVSFAMPAHFVSASKR